MMDKANRADDVVGDFDSFHIKNADDRRNTQSTN